jgi:flagellar motor switch protein FliN
MKKRDEEMAPETGDEFEAFEEWEGEGEGEGESQEEGSPEVEGGFAEEEPGEQPEEAPDELPGDELPEGEVPKEVAEETPETPEEPAAKELEVPGSAALDLAPDVPVQVVAVMGKRGVTIKELMDMRMGQVIDLKRPPNETVDVVVNGKLFARGELVEIDGKLGVKILKLVR